MPSVNDHVRVLAPFAERFPGVYLVDAVREDGTCIICGSCSFAPDFLEVTTDPLTAYAYIVPEIPQTITNPQLRQWLKARGYYATVNAYIGALAQQDPESAVIDFWERQYLISRSSPTVNALAEQLLGFSQGQIDFAFYEAGQIAI